MPIVYSFFVEQIIPAISRTLLHSLWQGMIAALVAGVIILATRKTSALTRYNALLLLFCSLLAAVGVTFFFELRSSSANNFTGLMSVSGVSVSIIEGNPAPNIQQSSFIATILRFVDSYSVLLVSIWFLFFSFQVTRMIIGLRQISKFRHHGVHEVSIDWQQWMQKTAGDLGIKHSVLILQSELAKIPVAIGYLKPVILVPVALLTQLSCEQAEAVLLHELAHIRRRDYLVNLLQSVVDAVFFFNPAFVWLSSLIRQEREKCCDDMVIRYTSNQRNYLEALVSFQEINLSSTYAMAIGSKKYYLLNRVKRILTRENSKLSLKEAISLLIGVIIISLSFVAFKPIIPPKSAASFDKHESIHQLPPTILSSPTFKDTVPKAKSEPGEHPLRFKKIISNMVDDGEDNTFQIQATEENGTVYKLRRKGKEVTGFSVNDKEIPKSEFHKYAIIMDAIDRASKKQMKHALGGLHEQQNEFEVHFDTLNNHHFELNLNTEKWFNDSLWHQEHLFNHNLDFETILDAKFDNSLFDNSVFGNSFSQNPTIAHIISDLLAEKLVKDADNVSFSLTNTELIVNGKTQSKSMLEKFKSKYIKHPSDRYKYSKKGKSTSTETHTN